MNETVLVTGANGFIGSSLTEELVRQGYKVRALMRDGCDESLLEGIACEHIGIDYHDRAAVTRACRDAAVVFHLAARASDWGDYRTFYEANVETTRAVAEAAVKARVPRLVFISSAVVYGCKAVRNARECDAVQEFEFDYSRTKLLGEKYVRGLKGIEVVIVRPGDVVGPRDRVVSAPMLRALRAGVMGYIGSGNALFCYTYIGNLVKAIVLAAERGRPGEAYNVSDGNQITYRQLFNEMTANLGCRPPWIRAPFTIAYPVSVVLEWIYSRLRVKASPPLTRYRVMRAARDCCLSIDKAVKELGYQPDLDFKAQIKATVDWYKQEDQRSKAGANPNVKIPMTNK